MQYEGSHWRGNFRENGSFSIESGTAPNYQSTTNGSHDVISEYPSASFTYYSRAFSIRAFTIRAFSIRAYADRAFQNRAYTR